MSGKRLRADGQPVELKDLGFVLVSDTLSAEVTTFPATAPGTRSGGPGLTRPMMQSAKVRELGTVMLQDHHPKRAQDKSVSLYVPGGGPEDGRLLLYFDENGGVTFHQPQEVRQPPQGVRAGRESVVRFEIPLRQPAPQPDEHSPVRGIGGMIAKKVLKVVGWKVVGAAARRVGPPLVRLWERDQRPMRMLSRDNLFVPQAPALETLIPPAERTLLFIHGTFSRTASAFNGIPGDEAFLAEIDRRYGSNIYGFDHATLASGVATNVMQLYEKFAPGSHTLDIICHSRGGLVARTLRDLSPDQLKTRFALDAQRGKYEDELQTWGEQWQPPDGVEIKVKRILFAGTPNNGTILAQPIHLKKYLEILMTVTNLLPEVVDVTVDAILMVAKLLLAEVMPELPGLDDQKPDSSLLPLLKDNPAIVDAAIEANYSPPPGLQAVMRTAVMHTVDITADFIFGNEQNDLVVPTVGVSQWRGGGFAPEHLVAFPAADSVHHCSLFLQKQTRQQLLAWLAK